LETNNTPTRWNLNNLQDGVDFKKIEKNVSNIKEKLTEIEIKSISNNLSENEFFGLSKLIKQIESAESFYYCLTTENVEPSFLTSLNSSISILISQVHLIITNWQDALSNMTEKHFDDWSNGISQKSFISDLLNDGIKRESSHEKIVSNFSRETLSGLENIYAQLRNSLKVKVVFDDGENEISFAEASNLAMSDPEYSKRLLVFNELNRTIETQSNVFASIYNQMVGIRLNHNKIKNVDYLEESLKLNGISKPTLNTMWCVVDSNLDELSKFLKVKAKEVDKEKLSWHELMTSSQEIPHEIKFSEAIDGITKSLEKIDNNMAVFVKGAITKGWVDAEQRKTKQPGGFCAPFLTEGESRISLNYDGSMDSARRLAHELGHAWHFQQIKDVPSLRFSAQSFEMTMAETSSIFFETAFIDYVIQDTKDFTLKKAVLGWKIERSLNYLMSIRGAFLFENRFYQSRKKGQLNVNKMEELSIQCQEKTYGNSLSQYEPYVWIKYGQFYQADIPFYNYPYSFGFLLSIGLLEIAKENKLFSQNFHEFLSETGTLPVEQLIKKHFDKDLSLPEFWQQSIQRILMDIEQYDKL
jgi:oligoendopeptidase F